MKTRSENKALKELDSGFEHIRRGAVESIQAAAVKTLFDTLQIIDINSILLRITCLEKVSRKEIRDFRMEARKLIVDGRSEKASPKTWTGAINSFSECIEKCFEMQNKFPDKSLIKWRIVALVGILITAISLVFGAIGVWAIFFR